MTQFQEKIKNDGSEGLADVVSLPHSAIAKIQAEIQEASKNAVAQSMVYAEKLAAAMTENVMAGFQEKLNSFGKPRVLSVEIDQVERPLKHSASPYLPRMLINAKLGLNTLLVGPAGCGKTMAAEQLAEALGREFGHICLTAGASETWLFGRQTPTGFVEGIFSKLYRNGGVFLADELDAADPNLLLAINTALSNGNMYNPISGETIARHPDFLFVGAANTNGRGGNEIYTGRARLDAATLDRFVIIPVDYNDAVERQVCPDSELYSVLFKARSELKRLKAIEVISTRSFDRAYRQRQAGVTNRDLVTSMTAGWPEELVSQTGLKAFGESSGMAVTKRRK